MLQRIQTVYLFLAIVFIALSVILPIAFYSNLIVGNQFEYSILKFLSPENSSNLGFNSLPLFVPAAISIILSIIAIFVFKNRKLQINLTVYSMVFNVVYVGLLAYYFLSVITNSVSNDVNVSHKYPLVFPVIALIFSYLAIRGIKKDEDLIKSVDRLR